MLKTAESLFYQTFDHQIKKDTNSELQKYLFFWKVIPRYVLKVQETHILKIYVQASLMIFLVFPVLAPEIN